MPLRGYRSIKGDSARRYITPSGKVISRREYDNRRARQAGFTNRYQLEKTRRQLAGSSWLGDIYSHTGKHPTWQDYHDLQEVKDRRDKIRAQYGPGSNSELDHHDPELVAADGPLARILDHSGKRPISGRPIGGS